MEEKSASHIRQLMREKRQSLSKQAQQQSAIDLTKQVSKLESVKQSSKVAIYLANDGELSTDKTIEWLWSSNINTYLPVVHPFSKGHLLFLQYHADSEMIVNQYGIKEPKLDIRTIISPSQFDVIFTPLVAFDNTGARVGMGGGYYDRTFASLLSTDSNKVPLKIGLAHDCQQLPRIKRQPWDMPLDSIITPSQIFQFNQ
ncbi:5-formyltetrahydrofolate cyclo-ligase [Thalassotalea ganghwensis]